MGQVPQRYPKAAAKVIKLPGMEERARQMPERWTRDELGKLLRNAARLGYTLEEVRYAEMTVRLWAETNGRRRKRWHLVVLNAMRQGWALRGFKHEQQRRGARHTRLSEERIEQELGALE